MEELLFENENGTFLVHHRKALSHHMAMSHFHTTYEVFYLMSGKRELFIKDRTIVIEEGDVIVIAPNVLHRTTNTEKPAHERLIVNIHESYMTAPDGSYADPLRPLFEKDYVIVKNAAAHPAVDVLAQQMIEEVQGKKPGFETYAQTLTLQLLIACCRRMNNAGSETPPPEYPSAMHERISEVVRYINAHYMDELSLHLLADKFYVSPYYLSRFFKEATGFTFIEYLNNVRVKEATTLLMRTSLKVNAIARKVGFGSVTHFGRVFKLVTGHPPLFYRRN
ncbi:AraC family transcriptional regulator [Paenibacillus sp. TRM 82003]|nr:AraC family transcriptional regulator [Paenibacillus sp. TRM 82003]